MTESCFVYKLMACCLGHMLVLSRHVTLPPYYPRLVIIALLELPVPLISFSPFNPLVFAVLCRFIVKLCDILPVSALSGNNYKFCVSLHFVFTVSLMSSSCQVNSSFVILCSSCPGFAPLAGFVFCS